MMAAQAPRVDAVITWVDGSDPVWLRKKHSYSRPPYTGQAIASANVAGRFRDHGELRYLLRSLARFWPFTGYIFVVTDGQCPSYLNTEHPRIRLIDHSDFMQGEHLPTFSSRAIESQLHRIPSLAEDFVAFNDDLFLCRPVQYADFFGTNGHRAYTTGQALPTQVGQESLGGELDAYLAHTWALAEFGQAPIDQVLEHYPRGIRRNWMAQLEAQYPDLFTATRSEKFRQAQHHSLLANTYPQWCAATGRAEVLPSQSLYLSSDALEHDSQALQALAQALDGRHLSACINDTADNRQDLDLFTLRYHRIMQKHFPQSCAFERSTCPVPEAASPGRHTPSSAQLT